MANSESQRRVEEDVDDTTDDSSAESIYETADDGSSDSESFRDRTDLAFDEIREENSMKEAGEGGQSKGRELGHFVRDILCTLCLFKFRQPFSVALCLCFTCSKYFCVECFSNHDTNHNYVNVNSNQIERERTRDEFLDEMWNERNIVEKLETENVCVCDRVYVNNEFDKDVCGISGLCGADNRRWVACDWYNSCIKVFQCGSNVLLRYLRIGSEPRDVTEIQVKQNSTVPDSASSSSSDISGTNRTKPDKQSLLAVTLPRERHILFIDINKTPAVRVKNVPTETKCYAIEYSEDKIFTVCDENPILNDSRYSVYVMSTDGVKLSVIQTGIHGFIMSGPDLAVLPGRVYLTDYKNNKVKCINYEGAVLSQIKIEDLQGGICVDPDNNVYVTTGNHDNNIYKLDLDLTGPPRSLLDPSTGDMRSPLDLCFYRDKLFISHGLLHNNIISVVMLV